MLNLFWLPEFFTFLTLLCSAAAAPTDVPSAASFYVPSLPDVHWDPNNPLTVFAGHLSAEPNATRAGSTTEVSSHLFFVLVKNRRSADKQRIAFWLNGGPGCSSFDGLMMEVGPWRSDGKGGFIALEGGWEEYTTMVFVDQPAGTGFSYASTDQYVHTIDEAAQQFVVFLRNFYMVFPEYKNIDTYYAGESFAGQFIPYYADAILKSDMNIPLRGIAIGNGWIDPRQHYLSYLDFAVKMGILEENSDSYKEAKEVTDTCKAEMDKLPVEAMNVPACNDLLLDVYKSRRTKHDGVDMCVNVYDIRLDDLYPACGMNWPAEIKNVTEYLGRSDVVTALHAKLHPGSWTECKDSVHSQFRESTLPASITILPDVLARIPVLIFAGDQDIICNYIGQENMIQSLTWNGATGLGTVQTQTWSVNGVPAGTWVSSRNLTYVKIFNASHMAAYDTPHVTHDMMLRFMGVNFSVIVEGSARIPSSVGSDSKQIFVYEDDAKPTTPVAPAKTPEQDKAMWEAYYNAGSAALVLILVFLVIGIIVWYRVRRSGVRLPVRRRGEDAEERIPLTFPISSLSTPSPEEKGKAKEVVQEPIFDVGDSDHEEDEDMHGATTKST